VSTVCLVQAAGTRRSRVCDSGCAERVPSRHGGRVSSVSPFRQAIAVIWVVPKGTSPAGPSHRVCAGADGQLNEPGGRSMSAQLNRAALLAGLLLALTPPALAADTDVPAAPPSASDESQLAMLSPTAQQGPIIARESLGTETKASAAAVNTGQPTRGSIHNLSHFRRARAANAGSSNSYRPSSPPLILGVRF